MDTDSNFFSSSVKDLITSIDIRDQRPDGKASLDDNAVQEAKEVLTRHYKEYNYFLKNCRGEIVLDNAMQLARLERQRKDCRTSCAEYTVIQSTRSRPHLCQQNFNQVLLLTRGNPQEYGIEADNTSFMASGFPDRDKHYANHMSRLQLLLWSCRIDKEERIQVVHFGGNSEVIVRGPQDTEQVLKAQEIKLIFIKAPCTIIIGLIQYDIKVKEDEQI